jgi:hypothetical protein
MHWPLFRAAVVDHSMEPALLPGDWLLAWRGVWTRRPPRVRPGQIVIAHHPAEPCMLIVKRAARQVADGWWLVADNQGAGGADSQSFGPVPFGLIHARVLMRYWPRRRH